MEIVIVALAAALVLALSGGWALLSRAQTAEHELDEVMVAVAEPSRRPSSVAAAAVALQVRSRTTDERLNLIERAVDRTELGIMVLDAELNVVYASAAAQRLLHSRHGEAATALRIRTLAEKALASQAAVAERIEMFEEEHRVLRVRIDPLVDEGVSVHIDDITDEERLDAMRRDFVANVGHELKTPVGALAVLAEALQGAPDEVSRRRLAARLSGEASRVATLVDDVMELSLVERDPTEMSRVDLGEVIAAATRRVEVLAEDSGFDVIADLPAATVAVMGDRLQLVSAVANLLDNAIRFSTASGDHLPEVHVRLVRDGGGAVVEVQDFGIGIPEPHQGRVFERFYRVDHARSRARGGTGLGLAIVRHVALNHGGAVEVDSTPGVGSTFRLRLPGITA